MSRLLKLASSDLADVAALLSITQLDGGHTERWRVNSEQRAVWEAGDRHTRRYVTKSRRIGISTALDLEDVTWTAINDAAGHRVRCGVVLHAEDKLKERFAIMGDLARQLDLGASCLATSITYPGGSEIFGITAGGQGSTRSEGAQRLRYEEFAFYRPGAYGEISPSVSLGVDETICTTIDIGAPNGIMARDMWRDTTNAYAKVFFPFELHLEYRADPALITDEQWRWAQDNGFSIRAAAAYWLTEVLRNKAGGDMTRAFREYPPTEAHMFASSESRWVRTTPRVLEPVDRVGVLSTTGAEVLHLLVYERPEAECRYTIGVDTATGKERDRSVVVVVDNTSRRLAASYVSDSAMGDDVARVAHAAWAHYSTPHRPHVRIEDNTTGQITIQPARRIGLAFEAFDTTQDSAYLGLLEAKRAVEEGRLEGPKELAEDCDELHRDADSGKWRGHKDVLMAYGFAALHIGKNPPKIGPVDIRADLHEQRVASGKRIMARLRAEQKGRWY